MYPAHMLLTPGGNRHSVVSTRLYQCLPLQEKDRKVPGTDSQVSLRFSLIVSALSFARVNATEEFDLLWQMIIRIKIFCSAASRDARPY